MAWYQWYFHTQRGKAGLERNRREICRLLWELWSSNWKFSDALFEETAVSFDNPDFAEIVIHSYRHRYGAAPSDPQLDDSDMLPPPPVRLGQPGRWPILIAINYPLISGARH
jgi:hypothetical protein